MRKRGWLSNISHISSHSVWVYSISFPSLSWLVQIIRKDARVHTSVSWKKRRFSQLYECMKEKFLWCLCDNDVSSFFLSPSACDLSSVFQLDSLCLGMMCFILRSWEEKVFHLQQSFLLNNYLLLPLTWSKIFSLLYIPPSIPSVCKFAEKVWKKRM